MGRTSFCHWVLFRTWRSKHFNSELKHCLSDLYVCRGRQAGCFICQFAGSVYTFGMQRCGPQARVPLWSLLMSDRMLKPGIHNGGLEQKRHPKR